MPDRRRRRHDDHEADEGADRWLITYADVITLLLAMFIVLYSISVVDVEKFKAFREAFDEGDGAGVDSQAFEQEHNPPDAGSQLARPGKPQAQTAALAQDSKALAQLEQRLRAAIARVGLTKSVAVAREERGVVVFVTDGVLFDSGAAQLLPAGAGLLDSLAPVFATVANQLDVEGHTDNVPIASASFPSNWELSTTRATTVLRFLIEQGQLKAQRMSASGYADTRPRSANTTPEQRGVNRRVEVVVLVPPAPVVEAPAEAPAAPAPVPQAPAEPASQQVKRGH